MFLVILKIETIYYNFSNSVFIFKIGIVIVKCSKIDFCASDFSKLRVRKGYIFVYKGSEVSFPKIS